MFIIFKNLTTNTIKTMTERSKQPYTSNSSNRMECQTDNPLNGNRPRTTTDYLTGNGKVESKNTKTSSELLKEVKGMNTLSINDKKGKTQSSYSPNSNNLQGPDIWVKKWVDYSSKYGLGYLLSNGSTGVFFNDSTKIVAHPKYIYFEYMERKFNDRQDNIS